MKREISSPSFLGAVAFLGATWSAAPPAEAQAVVYCKRPGFPAGCVARPVPAAPVVYCTRPGFPVGCAARAAPGAAAVYYTRPGYPAGCVDRGAPGPGVRPGVPGSRGGPANRIGPR